MPEELALAELALAELAPAELAAPILSQQPHLQSDLQSIFEQHEDLSPSFLQQDIFLSPPQEAEPLLPHVLPVAHADIIQTNTNTATKLRIFFILSFPLYLSNPFNHMDLVWINFTTTILTCQ